MKRNIQQKIPLVPAIRVANGQPATLRRGEGTLLDRAATEVLKRRGLFGITRRRRS